MISEPNKKARALNGLEKPLKKKCNIMAFRI
jgi:hypothetical protein